MSAAKGRRKAVANADKRGQGGVSKILKTPEGDVGKPNIQKIHKKSFYLHNFQIHIIS